MQIFIKLNYTLIILYMPHLILPREAPKIQRGSRSPRLWPAASDDRTWHPTGLSRLFARLPRCSAARITQINSIHQCIRKLWGIGIFPPFLQ